MLGDTVTAQWNFTDINTIYQYPFDGTATTYLGNPAIEFPNTSFMGNGDDNSAMTIYITATQIIFLGQYNEGCTNYPSDPSYPCSAFYSDGVTFNGFILSDTTSSDIASVTYDSATSSGSEGDPWSDLANNGGISFTSDSVTVNFLDLTSGPGESTPNELILDYTTTSSTPEPGAMLLTLGGLVLALVGRSLRSHRRIT
jgi:hypothetical protein